VHRCSYCDFFSLTGFNDDLFAALTDRICREITESADYLKEKQITFAALRSIFLGGGTPSLLPGARLRAIFEVLSRHYAFEKNVEITLEANPETVNDTFCEDLRTLTPVNRISLGVQSFDLENLKKLERLANPLHVYSAIKRLTANGFTNFNMDLIFGIPGQGRKGLLEDLKKTVDHGPKHISFYNLTLKPGHPLFKKLPSDDECAELYECGIDFLNGAGFLQYEISNFSIPGFESRHNLLYWDGGDFLGIGPSAASRFFWNGRFFHRKQYSDLDKYFTCPTFPAPGLEETTWNQTVLEATFLELRKNSGLHEQDFYRRYGYEFTQAPKFESFLKEGLIERKDSHLILTPRGRLLADMVTRELAP